MIFFLQASGWFSISFTLTTGCLGGTSGDSFAIGGSSGGFLEALKREGGRKGGREEGRKEGREGGTKGGREKGWEGGMEGDNIYSDECTSGPTIKYQ